MTRWKLFGRAKKEDSNQNEKENTETLIGPSDEEEKTEISIESSDEEKEAVSEPIAEYHETLQTGTTTSKTTTVKTTTPSEQRIWRDVDAIEENIDNIHMQKAKKPVTELDKKVDGIIEKRKKK